MKALRGARDIRIQHCYETHDGANWRILLNTSRRQLNIVGRLIYVNNRNGQSHHL